MIAAWLPISQPKYFSDLFTSLCSVHRFNCRDGSSRLRQGSGLYSTDDCGWQNSCRRIFVSWPSALRRICRVGASSATIYITIFRRCHTGSQACAKCCSRPFRPSLLWQLRFWSWMAKFLEMAMAGNEKFFSAAREGKEIDIERC
jgi:hypothetical protein